MFTICHNINVCKYASWFFDLLDVITINFENYEICCWSQFPLVIKAWTIFGI